MIKSRAKLKTYDGLVFCFIASVIIAIVAYNIGIVTEPGKILPVGISMRNGDMGENIIRGIDLAMEDLELIRSGKAYSQLWRLLTFVHMDLFFYIALLAPKAARTILLIGYYMRFGLCCSAMYYFMAEHIRLSRLSSALLGVMYTFSSQIVLTAQSASLMNMAIMMPVVLSAFDSYLQKRTWKSFIIVCLTSFGLAITGGYGMITGIPLMILISLLMCISLYSTFKMAFTSWLKLLGGMVTGVALSTAFALPGLLGMNINVDVAESFKNAKMNYTVFELIRGTFLLRSGSVYQNTVPLFYIGIFTLVAVIAFAVNESIPIRLKAASAVITAVIYITCSSSFVNETVSIFGTSAMLIASRLICIEVILFFIAGIGIRNSKSLEKGDFIASCLIPLFFLVISGNNTSGTTFASPIVISTFIGIVAEASLLYALAKDKLSVKGKYVVLFAVFFFVGVNTAFLFFNNTVQKKAVDEYFMVDYGDSLSENLIYDSDFDLPAINGGDSYQLIPGDLRDAEAGDSAIDEINYASMRASGAKLFEEIFLIPSDKKELRREGLNMYFLKEGTNVITFSPFTASEDERLFIYCNASEGASISMVTEKGDSARAFTGPFFTELEPVSGEVNVEFMIKSGSDDACHISLYRLNEDALNALKSLSGTATEPRFMIDVSGIDGTCTIVLPYTYDDTKLRIDGISCDTFDYCGKLATTFVCNNGNLMEVSVERKDTGLLPGILVSVFMAACLVAIPVAHMYNEKKKVTGEGTDSNA